MTGVPPAREVRLPQSLTSLLRELKDAVAAEELEQIRDDSSQIVSDLALDDVADSGPWPDYLELRFRHRKTGTRYRLSVETYHGVGGTWGLE